MSKPLLEVRGIPAVLLFAYLAGSGIYTMMAIGAAVLR